MATPGTYKYVGTALFGYTQGGLDYLFWNENQYSLMPDDYITTLVSQGYLTVITQPTS